MSRVPITPPSNSTPAADRRLGQAVVLGWQMPPCGLAHRTEEPDLTDRYGRRATPLAEGIVGLCYRACLAMNSRER
jgi:hypothetical protein